MRILPEFIHNAILYFRSADDPLNETQLHLLKRLGWRDLKVVPHTNRRGEIFKADVVFYGNPIGAAYGTQFVLTPDADKRNELRFMAQDISDLLYR